MVQRNDFLFHTRISSALLLLIAGWILDASSITGQLMVQATKDSIEKLARYGISAR